MNDPCSQTWNSLAIPTGALDSLLAPLQILARTQGRDTPSLNNVEAWIFCSDNGIASSGKVNHYPQLVTRLMTQTFLHEKSVSAVLAKQNQARLNVANCGIEGSMPLDAKGFKGSYLASEALTSGTRDIQVAPAMPHEAFDAAWNMGERAVLESAQRSADLVILGEMGIGNTSTATAVAKCLLNFSDTNNLVGLGAGLPPERLVEKKIAIELAINRFEEKSTSRSAKEVLRELGGFDLVAMTAAFLKASELSIPVLLDGFIVSVAALAAHKIKPLNGVIPATLSRESAHGPVLECLELDCKPLLELSLCLGEASAALLALPLLKNAIAILKHTATLTEVLALQETF